MIQNLIVAKQSAEGDDHTNKASQLAFRIENGILSPDFVAGVKS